MREIKFRAWNGEKYISFDNHKYDLVFNDISGWNVKPNILNYKGEWICGESQSKTPQFNLEQFTGLTDKNGKEIYENDLVRILAGHIDNKERVFQIVYAMGCFSLEPLDLIGLTTLGYYFNLCVENGVFKHCKECDGSVFEIIGNIHENPELL